MSPMRMLKIIFNSQIESDWDKIKYEIEEDKEKLKVHLKDEAIVFVFDKDENFIGLYNYKE